MDNKTNKMLIDATHPEETRVVVLRNGRVEEFDYESAARKLLRGNIYLAKVTRVEPSLQAAFVEYGGNRHGFLAFNEIHPDYYQIPVSDRQALIDEEAAAEAEADAEADARAERRFQGSGSSNSGGGNGQRRRDGRGGRNGNRNRDGRDESRNSAAPAGTGEQPATGAHDAGSGQEPHDSTAHSQPQSGDGAPEHHAHDHDHHQDHGDAGGTHEPHSQHDDTRDDTHVTQAEASGHDSERVSEPYASDEQAHDQQHQGHDHTGHDHASHDHAGDDHAHHDNDHAADHDHAAHDPAHTHGEADAHEHAHYADAGDTAPRHEDRAVSDHIEEVPEVTEAPETIGAEVDTGMEDDGAEDVQERPRRQRRRQYKIQEVIKRRQVILVQVVKEERGNKGAALTTYLSLAGRYTVLMPNTGRGGGISRKITNPGDRKRLKAIAQELDVPEGMGLIIRTAGAARTSQEIKRDYEYLLRLWESVREMTLQSTAPSLVYEEGNLIKRSIRDLYTKEIDEVVVAGDQAYHDAHDFMRMLMPSHAKHVIKYNHPEALFTRYPIERQLNAMFSPYVTLKSGGYLVINQTEALVSIDVNSGKSTREYSIEETALATNLEASDEIARQLKLRDLAGLIVIDFIDMEEKRNNRKVEHRLTDALRFDRARIQVGRISHFGLMEMSRQRMRTGVLEGSTSQCPHCQGTGMIRSVESVALAVLRGLEDHLVKDPRSSVNVMTTATVALYILNNKRSFITDIERRYGISVAVQASDRMQGANFAIERSAAPVQAPRPADRTAVSMDWGFDGEEAAPEHEEPRGHDGRQHENAVEVVDGDGDEGDEGTEAEARGDGEGNKTGRRRRRRRGRDRDRGDRPNNGGNGQSSGERVAAPEQVQHGQPEYAEAADFVDDTEGADVAENGHDANGAAPDAGGAAGEEGERQRRGRRRGRRGGRRGREQRDDNAPQVAGDEQGTTAAEDLSPSDADVDDIVADDSGHEEAIAPHDHQPAAAAVAAHASHPTEAQEHTRTEPPVASVVAAVAAPTIEAPIEATTPVAEATTQTVTEPVPVTKFPEAPEDPTRPRRRGWWQRRGLGE